MRKILLDTNAYSHLLKGDKQVLEELDAADLVYMSTFVLGELLAGFKGGNKEITNKKLLDKFLNKNKVQQLPASRETSELFAEVKHNLRKAGTPIPINDVWIAAHAFEIGAVLVSYDAHFSKVPGLRLWDYIR